MTFEEPEFSKEKELEDAIAEVANRALKEAGVDGLVLRGFGLDLAVFLTKDRYPAVRLFEIKTYSEDKGRCGFGNQKGEGIQIQLLFDSDRGEPRGASQLKLFDASIRWVLGNRSKPVGSARFAFFTCEQAQAAAAKGVRPGKQNNFRISAFESSWITWPELIRSVTGFVVDSTDPAPSASH